MPEDAINESDEKQPTPPTDEPPPQAIPVAPPVEVNVSGTVRVNGKSGVNVTQGGAMSVKRVGVDDPHIPPEEPAEEEPQQP